MLTIYMAGEIHTNWREEIISLCSNKKLNLSKLANKPICIIIGPEGDFSEQERKNILTFEDISSIKINENILRSETAAISAISIINYFSNL